MDRNFGDPPKSSERKIAAKDQTSDLLRLLLSGLNSPRALAVWMLYESGEHRQLVDLPFDSSWYNDLALPRLFSCKYRGPKALRQDYLATSILSKAEFLELNVKKSDVALEKFRAAENKCAQTNRRLANMSGILPHAAILPIIEMASRKIDTWLGNFDPNEYLEACRHSGGATVSTPRHEATIARKFSDHSITYSAYTLIQPFIFQMTGVPESEFIPDGKYGNRVSLVPKNAKTDRVIAVEPCWNMYLQLGVGEMLRRRLRRNGYDINTQLRNQQLAERALELDLTTVDFKAASDTISKGVVELLLPASWKSVMDRIRCAEGILEGNRYYWSKYSTMGNGFTFELETLIFAALAEATCKYLGLSCQNVCVFGDDVIIPSDAFTLYQTVTMFLGFEINLDKTFSTGLFRESCGSYWFMGIDVKPFYLKHRLDSRDELFQMANRIRWFAHNPGWFPYCDKKFRRVWQATFEAIDKPDRIRGPVHLGDSVVHANFDEIRPYRAPGFYCGVSCGWEGYTCSAFLNIAPKIELDYIYTLYAHLYRQSRKKDPASPKRLPDSLDVDIAWGNLFPAKRDPRFVRRKVRFVEVYNLGPWI